MKYFRNYLLISTSILLSYSMMAQQEYTSKSFNHQLSPLKLSLTVVGMEDVLYPITAGLMVEGQVLDRVFYNIEFRQGYIRNFNIPITDLITTQKESKGTVFEAGIDWAFSEKIKPGKVKVSTSFDYLEERFFLAKCEIRKCWALSGGVFYYKRAEYVNSDSSYYLISGGEDIKAPPDHYTSFNLTTFGIYGGIASRRIKKVMVNTNGRNYRVYNARRFYAQALIGPTVVGDIIYNNQTYKIDNTKHLPLGYRIGWQWDENGIITCFEFGKMPGVELETPVEKNEIDKTFKYNPFLNYVRLSFSVTLFHGDSRYGM